MDKTYKTYESLWHNPETGIDLIIARGDSEEYVRKMAQMSQFVPYAIREYQTPENVREMYRDWRKENGNRKPNRAIVKMRWEDGNNTEKGYQIDTIAFVPKRKLGEWLEPADDFEYLYYVSSLKGLLDLMQPGNGSDFIVDEVLEFYKK